MSRLNTLLNDQFNIDNENITKAKSFIKEHGGRLESVLENMGLIDEVDVANLYASYFDLQYKELKDIDRDNYIFDGSAPYQNELNTQGWVVGQLAEDEEKVVLFTANPFSNRANVIYGRNFENKELIIVTRSDLDGIVKSFEQTNTEDDTLSLTEVDRLKEAASEAPVVNLLNNLMVKGLKLNASDMHVEPLDKHAIVRYRVDGVLIRDEKIPQALVLPLAARLKILSDMDISEKRRPQDGKIETKVSGQELDIRVSCLPISEGESFVLRFLKKESISYDLERLGMEQDVQALIEADIRKTSGVVLLTGPTGSGKTTTLYSCLSKLNSDKVKIITLEDPVEYQLENVNQVQVNPEIGFDFADGLRSIVRQDPDIIMLGEIRDQKTAQVAMQSALTGHLVFSTVHTNDAPSAFTRLLDLGVDEFLLDAALVSIVAQRLARKLCECCAEPVDDSEALINKYHVDNVLAPYNIDFKEQRIMQAKGCESCNYTGFKGRIALIEYLRCDDEVSRMDKDEAFLSNLRALNKERGHRHLLADGFLKALKGLTTFKEVSRVAG